MGQPSTSILRHVIDGVTESLHEGEAESLDGLEIAPAEASEIQVKASHHDRASLAPREPAMESLSKVAPGHSGHMKLLFENAPVAMAMFDSQMRYILANRRWIEDFKLQSVEITGRSQYELFPALHPGWRHVYERALGGQVVRSDRDAMTQEGRPVVYRWEVRPWRHPDTTVGGIMITCTRMLTHGQKGTPENTVSKDLPPVITDGLWQSGLPLLLVDATGIIVRSSKGAASLFLDTGLQEGVTSLSQALGGRDEAGTMYLPWQSAIESLLNDRKSQVLLPSFGHEGASRLHWLLSKVEGGSPGPSPALVLATGLTELPAGLSDNSSPADPVFSIAHSAPAFVASASSDGGEVESLRLELQQAQDAVQTSRLRETRLRAVLDLAPCGLLVLDERARPIYHNANVQSLLGRSLAEGQNMEEWIAQGSRDQLHREEITRQWREGVWRRQLTTSLTLATADDLLKDIEMRPVSLPGGGLMIMMQDVTDAQRSEEMLRSTEAKFRTLVHENPHPVILTDRTGSVFDVNPSAEILLGYTRAELRRMNMERWLDASSISGRAQALQEMAQHADRSKSLPVVIINREGLCLPVTLRLATVPDAQGEPIFTVHFLIPAVPSSISSAQDTTPAESEPAPESFLLESAGEMPASTRTKVETFTLLETDVHGRIQLWTSEAEEHFGLGEDLALGRGLHVLFRPSDATGFYTELSGLPVDQGNVPKELAYYHAEKGRQVSDFLIQPQEACSLSVLLSKSHLVEVPAASVDAASAPVTATQSVPTPLELSREKLLLGETHHRVKNHLQIVTSMLNLQMSTLQNAEARDALRSSQNRVRSIAALHQHLYQLATGETGRFSSFAHDLISHLRECFEVDAERVRLQLQVPDRPVPEEWLLPLSLSLNEMVSNAFKHAYAHGRAGEMLVKLAWNDEQGILSVCDDGHGLSESYDDHNPSGMGLKILRVFAGQIGGEIKISSAPGQGAEFRLCFPVAVHQV